MKKAIMLVMALVLAACGSSNLIVMEPVKAPAKTDAVTLVYDGSTVGVPEENITKTRQLMEEAFYGGKAPLFRNATGGVTIKYGYLSYKPGSQFGRYMLGGLGVGKAKMVLRADFVGADGVKLGSAQADAEISGGFFGGSSNSAIKKAVGEIRNYAAAQLK